MVVHLTSFSLLGGSLLMPLFSMLLLLMSLLLHQPMLLFPPVLLSLLWTLIPFPSLWRSPPTKATFAILPPQWLVPPVSP